MTTGKIEEEYEVRQPRRQVIAAGERPMRVLVVDDEPLIVQMLTIALSYEGFEVTVARDSLEAINKLSTTKPDLLILDGTMPNMHGIEVAHKLWADGEIGILMLTNSEGDAQVTGLKSGADAFLTKPFTLPVLLARIETILHRKGINLQSILHVGDVLMDRATHRVERGERPIKLTPREFDLLDMLLSHPRQVFTRHAIVNRVWGYDFYGDTNIVDVYVSYLREKLGDEARTLIRAVRGIGYALDPSDTRIEQGSQDERAQG